MVGRSVGVIAAASVLTAQALLIPPGVQSIDETVQLQVVNTNWQSIKLSCPECVFPTKQNEVEEAAEGDTMWIQGGANSLLVNVSTLFGGNAIGLDNYPLYPPLASYQKAKVDMIHSDATMVQLQDGSANRLPVEVSADSSVVKEEVVSPDSDSVIRIKYQIMSIDHHPVTVDGIEIIALKDKQGKMDILNVESVPKAKTIFDSLPPTKPSDPSAAPPHRPCKLPASICHFRDMVEAKMNEIKAGLPTHLSLPKPGCHGRKGKGADGHRLPGHRRPPHFGGMDAHRPEGHHGRPHRFHKHPDFMMHHHRHHSTVHRAVQGILFVIVPIFLGITMGMLVSMIGMIVGRLIAFLWVHFVRGGRRGYASVRLDEDEAEEAEKDDVESVVSEPLPVYEEAPAYEEKERV